LAANIPSTSAIQGDFQASTMAENHQHLFSSNNMSNTLADNHSNGLSNPFTNAPQNTFKDPFANSHPIDPSSALFLHNGDNPGIILVPQPLTEENYSIWSHSMLVALSAKTNYVSLMVLCQSHLFFRVTVMYGLSATIL
jgi:hypothetical protein